MSIIPKVEHCGNHFLAAYNLCVDLGVEKIIHLFDLKDQAQKNEPAPLLRETLNREMGKDGIEEIQHIVEKLKKREHLQKLDQIFLGMAFHSYADRVGLDRLRIAATKPASEAKFVNERLQRKQQPKLQGRSRLCETSD